jgi:arsenite-transporting ATPase
MLRRMADIIYGDKDPAAVWFSGKVQSIETQGDGYVLRLPLGFASKEQLDVLLVGDELILQVGSYKRNIIVPRALAQQQVRSAKLENGELRITFRPRELAGLRAER